MKIKKVNRYFCDYCKKANCCAPAMKKHEKRCTMNPNRFCGMCAVMDNEQPKLEDLMTILPKPVMIEDEDGKFLRGEFFEEIERVFDKLRDKAENCPACILAALRQKGIPIYPLKFNFTEECKKFWEEINEAHYAGRS